MRTRVRSLLSLVESKSYKAACANTNVTNGTSNVTIGIVHRPIHMRQFSTTKRTGTGSSNSGSSDTGCGTGSTITSRNTGTVDPQRQNTGISIHSSVVTANDWSIKIIQDGAGLSFESHLSSSIGRTLELAAPWLWIHDPQFVHPTSGQKLRTFGQYSTKQHRILQATLVPVDTNVPSLEYPFPPPPPIGSYHPRGGVYDEATLPHPSNDHHDRLLLQVSWADETMSFYDWDWLLRFSKVVNQWSPSSSSSSSSSSNTSTTRVTKDIAIGALTNPHAVPMPTLDYNHILHTDEGRWEALHGIFQHGAILIQNSPINKDPQNNNGLEIDTDMDMDMDMSVIQMGQRLSGGRLSHGALYGDTFHVESQPNATNIAYTTVALPPHQDLTYYESKPFLQLLQCITNAGKGGASILIDAMAAAEYLQTIAPDLFDILCRVEATFIKQRPGADMVSFKPHIVVSTSYQNTKEVIEINWSPPFEGPPLFIGRETTNTTTTTTTMQEMENYIRAYQAMECLLDNQFQNNSTTTLLTSELQEQCHAFAQDYTWEYILQPGDMLVFNNQRMCHGRRAFELVGSHQKRHLIGCYTDAMETINQYRLLRRTRRNQQSNLRNVGNGTRAGPLWN